MSTKKLQILGSFPEPDVYAAEESVDTSVDTINADTLGGHPASDFALAHDVENMTYTYEDVGAAPAGFGLGKYPDRFEYSQIDTLLLPGWYRVNVNTTINGVHVDVAHMEVSAVNKSNVVQTLYTITCPVIILVRQNYSGVWQPWECNNPPMIPGVEYRTTERWNGEPVYTVSINCNPTTPGGNVSNLTSFTCDKVIRFAGNICDYCVPFLFDNSLTGSYTAYATAHKQGGYIQISCYTGANIGSGNATIQVWYTKD